MSEEKKAPFCYRCKRQMEEGETYQLLVLPSGARVPVCSQDRECYQKRGVNKYEKQHDRTA